MRDNIILVASTAEEELDALATDLAEAAAQDTEVIIKIGDRTYIVNAEHVIVPLSYVSFKDEGYSNRVRLGQVESVLASIAPQAVVLS